MHSLWQPPHLDHIVFPRTLNSGWELIQDICLLESDGMYAELTPGGFQFIRSMCGRATHPASCVFACDAEYMWLTGCILQSIKHDMAAH